MLAGFIPEQWPASNRNPWPTSVGIITQQVGADLAAARQRIELLHGQLTDACTAQARAEAQRDAATERLADTRTERDAALERLTLPRKVF
jgi:hypothetical protein